MCTDVNGQTLTYSVVTTTTHGLLTFNANGSFTYMPNLNYNGPDSFTFRANDGMANSNTVTYSITVTPVNDAPVAVADSYALNEDGTLTVAAPGVLGNDTDVENNTLTAVLNTNVSNGSLSLAANGSFTYTPTANFCGTDSFTYHANDGAANSNIVTVTLTVNCVNDAPVVTLSAANDLTVNEGTNHTYSFTVSDAGGDTFTVVSVSCGANGTQVGTTTTTASGGSFVCTFPDGPASSTVSVQVKDSTTPTATSPPKP